MTLPFFSCLASGHYTTAAPLIFTLKITGNRPKFSAEVLLPRVLNGWSAEGHFPDVDRYLYQRINVVTALAQVLLFNRS